MCKSTGKMLQLFTSITVIVFLFASGSLAQSYPVKPIRIIVGYSTGGATDTTARMVAQKLSEIIGQNVIVENRPGATGTIALQAVATSPADGYTLVMLDAAAAIVAVSRAKLPYDLQRDFAPVSPVTSSPFVLVVHPSVPARDVRQLIALARSQPGKLNYSTSGVGSSAHFLGELFSVMAKAKLVHVPYKGSVEGAIAVATGEIELSFPSLTGALSLGSRIRALAVTSANRSSLAPSLPTMHESGLPGYDRFGWWGIIGPAGVPKNIILRLNSTISEAVTTPAMTEAFHKQRLEVRSSTPEQFATFIRNEIEQNSKLIKLAGMKIDP